MSLRGVFEHHEDRLECFPRAAIEFKVAFEHLLRPSGTLGKTYGIVKER